MVDVLLKVKLADVCASECPNCPIDRFQPSFVSCSFIVPPRLTVRTTNLITVFFSPNLDRNGNLAVGVIASLVDEIGATVIYEKNVPMNVSVDMSISYLSTAKLNGSFDLRFQSESQNQSRMVTNVPIITASITSLNLEEVKLLYNATVYLSLIDVT
ncbi:hypothetical protein LXL04_019980 [Taraxacum kok-saghyz]